MPSPNIFYAYTESYPPSMHPSQLWKYNNCNSFPKVGTSVYTSAKNRKTSCLIPSAELWSSISSLPRFD